MHIQLYSAPLTHFVNAWLKKKIAWPIDDGVMLLRFVGNGRSAARENVWELINQMASCAIHILQLHNLVAKVLGAQFASTHSEMLLA